MTPDLRAQVAAAAETLRCGADPATARLDAELLAAHLLGINRSALLLREKGRLDAAAYGELVARRAAGEPLALITGKAEFWSLPLRVNGGALVPRADSETLIEEAIASFSRAAPRRILDLGTGSGCLLLAALHEFPSAHGLGIDRSAAALRTAASNAAALGLSERAAFRRGNWTRGIEGRFDLILCNPPYIADGARLGPGIAEYEPAAALFAGRDGLEAYRRILPDIPALLSPEGHAVFEIGLGQAEAVRGIASAAGLRRVRTRRDLAGHLRALNVSL